MIMLACIALSSLDFVQQEIPGNFYTSFGFLEQQGAGVRRADFDGDGANDLVMDQGIAFQRNGRYAVADVEPLPTWPTDYHWDLWHATLYVRTLGKLDLFRWETGWQHVLSQELVWPAKDVFTQQDFPPRRFLFDINNDDDPEIIVPGEDGLHVYTRGERWYYEASLLDVYPSVFLTEDPAQPVWPVERRAWRFPSLGARPTLWMQGGFIHVLQDAPTGDGRLRYATTRYSIDASTFRLRDEQPERRNQGTVPPTFKPCFLNPGDTVDFVEYQQAATSASAVPKPVYRASISTDGGNTFQSFQTVGFSPHTLFVDYNRDDRLDLVLCGTDLFDGGIRETALRFLTGTYVTHEIRIHLQDERNQFSTTPDIIGRFSIAFEERPWFESRRFLKYRSSGLVNLDGDFNGDGYHDACVAEKPREIRIYYGGKEGFEPKPSHILKTEEESFPEVADIDGDGRYDVCARTMGSPTQDGAAGVLFLNRETKP
ncbi:MAG: hypothetical protein AMXMBFR84_31370 [Candidatus Hydrogenedentota bacterium]